MKVPKIKDHDFACRCSDEESLRCDAIMRWALDFLSRPKHEVTTENLLTAFIYRMSWAYRAELTGIPCDQWCAVLTSTYDSVEKDGEYTRVEPPVFLTFIECDRVEDGIAFTLKAYYDKFGDSRK